MLRRLVPLYLALIPTMVLVAIFGYYPAINGLYHAFFEWHPGFESPFTGLTNFRNLLDDSLFIRSFEHVGYMALWRFTAYLALPLFAAELLITLTSERARFVFRTLLILPLAFPIVVHTLLWGFMFNPNEGLINTVLRDIGLGSLAHNWLGDPTTALTMLMIINFPWIASLQFLVFLAGLQNIPTGVFDAAALDGCGRWRRFWRIDLPMLATQLKLIIVLVIINVLEAGMTAAILTDGGPDFSTTVPLLRMINAAFEGNEWGYAAAQSFVLFIMTLVFSVFALLIRRKEGSGGTA